MEYLSKSKVNLYIFEGKDIDVANALQAIGNMIAVIPQLYSYKHIAIIKKYLTVKCHGEDMPNSLPQEVSIKDLDTNQRRVLSTIGDCLVAQGCPHIKVQPCTLVSSNEDITLLVKSISE